MQTSVVRKQNLDGIGLELTSFQVNPTCKFRLSNFLFRFLGLRELREYPIQSPLPPLDCIQGARGTKRSQVFAVRMPRITF